MKPLKFLLPLSLPVAVAACGASPGDSSEARLLDEHAKITTEDPSSTRSFFITHGSGTVALMPASQGFCYITSFTGDLDSESEHVRLDIDSGGTWSVAVDDVKPDFTNQIAVTVACTAFSDFTPFGGGAISPTFSGWSFWAFDAEIGQATTPLPTSTELCYLTGFGGMFNGAGESVTVRPGALTVFSHDGDTDEATLGDARCIQLATSGGGLMKPLTTVTRTLSQGSSPVDLIPANQGICFMTGVTGNFRGKGDAVAISRNDASGNWQMSVNSGSQGLAFTASCIPFDQSLKVINAVNAGSPPSGPIQVRWAMNPGANVTTWAVHTTSGAAITMAADPSAPNSFETTIGGSLNEQVQVCATLPSSLAECSPWIAPKDSTKPEWYDITDPDILHTGWGTGFSNGPWTVPWSQASRAAYAFCRGVGFVGGQLNGWWGGTNGNYGVICYGDNAAYENSFEESNPNETNFPFWDVGQINWAWGARAASDLCTRENSGSMGGWFNGNEYDATVGLVCYHAPSQWFDSTPAQLNSLQQEAVGLVNLTDGHYPDQVTWDLGARVADRWCQDCTDRGWCPAANGRHFVSGRFNGYFSATNLGLVCY